MSSSEANHLRIRKKGTTRSSDWPRRIQPLLMGRPFLSCTLRLTMWTAWAFPGRALSGPRNLGVSCGSELSEPDLKMSDWPKNASSCV